MKIGAVLSVIFGGRHGPPKGELNQAVSSGMQEFEVAIARFNKVACNIEHGEGCNCYVKENQVFPIN